MKKQICLALLTCTVLVPGLSQRLTAQEVSSRTAPGPTASAASDYVVFDIPGSVPGSTGAIRFGIDSHDTVAGYYNNSDGNGSAHAFYRLADGAVTIFDAPGAVCTGASGSGTGCTTVTAISPGGTIIGWYQDANLLTHGFLRDPHGSYTLVDVAGASGGTTPSAINSAGAITGSYSDATGTHGFLRDPQGNFISFDPSNAIGTAPASINSAGDIVGSCNVNGFPQAFLRSSDGRLTYLTPSADASLATDIDDGGRILVQILADIPSSYLYQSGDLTYIHIPGSSYTGAVAIDGNGTIVGSYQSYPSNHGFYRLLDGTYASFDPPGTGMNGPVPFAVNSQGDIAGVFFNSDGHLHAFIRLNHQR
jgi:hypothetical protein